MDKRRKRTSIISAKKQSVMEYASDLNIQGSGRRIRSLRVA